MKKNSSVMRTKAEPIKTENLVIQDITIRNVDRTPKDVGKWRTAHITASSVHYPNRTQLYDLYADIILDGHLFGIIYNKRIATVRNKVLSFVKNGKKVDEMDTFINSKVFRDIKTKILEAPAYGVSGMQFIPGEDVAFEEIPRKHIKPEFGVIAKEQSDYTGYEYSKLPLVMVVGEKYDLGYLLVCAFYALIKKGDFSDWAQFVEIFGQPIRVIKYDAYDNKTKIELKQVLDESGSSLALMIPKQADFEIMDGKGANGDGKLQESLKTACNDEMSVTVLGVTETTTSSKSSGYAQSDTHQKQQSEVVKDDMTYLLDYVNSSQFLSILKSYGLPVDGGAFEFKKEIDLEALKVRKEIDMFVSGKVPVSDDYFYDTYGIPKPDNYDELKAKMEERSEMALQQQQPPAPGKPPKPGKTGKPASKDKEQMKLSAWDKFRLAAADFFDPAHNDQ